MVEHSSRLPKLRSDFGRNSIGAQNRDVPVQPPPLGDANAVQFCKILKPMPKSGLRNSHPLRCLEEKQPIFRRSPPFSGQRSALAFDVLNLKYAVRNDPGALDLGRNMQPQPLLG